MVPEVGSLKGQSQCRGGVKVEKIVFLGAFHFHLLRHFCCRSYRFATAHSVTDRRTDIQHYHANSQSHCVNVLLQVTGQQKEWRHALPMQECWSII